MTDPFLQTGYLGIPLYLIMIAGYKIIYKTKEVKPHEADLWSGKDIIDRDEQEWLAKEAEDRNSGKRGNVLYRKTLGVLF